MKGGARWQLLATASAVAAVAAADGSDAGGPRPLASGTLDHAAPAGVDAARLPDDEREGPGGDEDADADEADAAEVEVLEEGPEPAAERELGRGDLQQLD